MARQTTKIALVLGKMDHLSPTASYFYETVELPKTMMQLVNFIILNVFNVTVQPWSQIQTSNGEKMVPTGQVRGSGRV